MPVYLVTSVDVTDPEKYLAYTEAGHAAVIKNGGRFLAEGAMPLSVEGTWLPKRMAIVEFPDEQTARAFYDSPEYTAARAKRAEAAAFNMILVPGVS